MNKSAVSGFVSFTAGIQQNSFKFMHAPNPLKKKQQQQQKKH